MRIKQGDAYDIEIVLTDGDGTEVTPAMVSEVEVMLGKLRKTYPGDLTYDGVWIFPLTQEDTLKIKGIYGLEARVRFNDGTVVGAGLGVVAVMPSKSRKVLE